MNNKYDNIYNRRQKRLRICSKNRKYSSRRNVRRIKRDNFYIYISAYTVLRKYIVKYCKIFIVLFIIIAIWKLFMAFEDIIGNSLENAAEIKMREYVENIVVHSVHKVLRENEDGDRGIYEYEYTADDERSEEIGESSETTQIKGIIEPVLTEDGRVAMITLNTDIINKTGNEIAMEVNDDVHDGNVQILKVSIGAMLGSRVLSQITPMIKFKMIPVSVSEISYKTEFEEAGINQTKYKVYMIVNTEARVMAPFLSENVKVENTVLVAETVIVGEVPDTYANIPGENIPDFVS